MTNIRFKRRLAVLASVLLFGGNIAFAQTTPMPGHEGHNHDQQSPADTTPVPIMPGSFAEIEGDHVLGDINAPETMIIYASVTCPHCADWFEDVWPSIKADYVETGKLRIVFREFPTQPAQLAFAGFLIANCAPEDQYFEMIEHQMSEQKNLLHAAKLGVAKEAYLDVAKKAGLADEEAMNTCLADKEGIERIQYSLALAQSAQIPSVPNFIIGGELYMGRSDLAPLSAHLNGLSQNEFSPLPAR